MHNVYVMELPQMKRDKDLAMWRSEIVELMHKVEELTGKKVTVESLRASIKEVNDKRRALQRIGAARAADPAPISGKDALLATQVAFYDDVPRFTQSVNAIADELEQRIADGVGAAPKGAPRILVTGTPMALPNWKLHDIIEKAGGVVVGEEMCTGSRYYEKLVDEDAATLDDMIDDIAEKYLDINCACFTPNKGRIDDVIRLAKDLGADGVIDYTLQFCGTYQIESGAVEKAVQDAGLPVLKIDTDYSMEDVGQLSTRIEAFLEMVK
jgi:benzoyl-CoA reductase/2-hydroxyglutaryl-CoA dehydratase subunit BcrC/BadD/HgdB